MFAKLIIATLVAILAFYIIPSPSVAAESESNDQNFIINTQICKSSEAYVDVDQWVGPRKHHKELVKRLSVMCTDCCLEKGYESGKSLKEVCTCKRSDNLSVRYNLYPRMPTYHDGDEEVYEKKKKGFFHW